jgi:gliding motility-associated lipoprotein GldB
MRKIAWIFIVSIALFACNKKDKCSQKPNVKPLEKGISLVRTEKVMTNFSSKAAVLQFLNNDSLFANKFLQRGQYPHDSVLVNILFNLSEDKSIDTLREQTDLYFGELSDVKSELEQAFSFVKHYYPEFVIPKVYTVVTGFGHDLYASDSIVVIGLDYFLGDKGKYHPDVPNYMLKRFKKEYIVPSIVLLLSDKYNLTNILDNTLLAEMVHYGKSYYFVEKILPCTPDSLIIGYSEKELIDTREHESIVWSHFIEQKLLFETSHFILTKYVGERPYTAEIGAKCPGRIGRWLGWQIVNKYMQNHPEATLADVMKEKDARKIFNESHYKPEK